jgi:Rha family phage regulatory protein
MGPDGSESKIPVVFERDGRVYANSRDVAAFFEKRHDNVLADIRGLLKSQDTPSDWFIETETTNEQNGQAYRTFDMNRDGFTLLVMSYTGPKAMAFKVRYIQRFNEMESALKNPLAGFAIPTTLAEALRLAADQSEKLAEQARKIEVMTPKVDGFDRIAAAEGSMCVTDAAKDLQVRPKDLFNWMSGSRWIYQRPGKAGYLAYQDKIQAGYLEHKVTTVSRSDGSEKVVEAVRVTARGLAKLAQKVPGARRPGPSTQAAEARP